MNKCQNPECPNDGNITVQIFKGTGACSVDCKKALGWEPVVGDLVMLTPREAKVIAYARRRNNVAVL